MSEKLSYKQREHEFFERAKEIVSQMTLEEKVAQTLHSAPAIKRLNIKAYNWWNESLHGVARSGVATVFPQAIGMAATFDEEIISEVGRCIADEARAKFNIQQKYEDYDIYKGLTFWAPNINIFRDPRWGRGHETLGEDPFLTSKLAVSYIKAMQGDDEYMKVAACAKHFAVHSGPEDIRHSFNAVVSDQDLYETYLPAFEACVKEAEVEAVMGAYNRTNDEPCCGSEFLLQDILRKKWDFKGHVVSDCWAIKDFHEYHRVTNSPIESVSLAMNNGCDLNCGNLFVILQEAVEQGLVKESTLDEAVIRLFVTRMKLGLFENNDTVPFDNIPYTNVDTKENKELNFEVSRKSVVLLKNEENLLPLNKDKINTIGIIGPNANNRRALVGNYEGTASRYYTLSEGIQDYVGGDVRVLYSEGCHLYKEKISGLGQNNDRLSEVKAVCAESDVVIACMGLDSGLEGEEGDMGNQYASGDKPNLNLPGLQEDILREIVKSGKPVVLVLLSGSALAINFADENIPAIVQGWYPGAEGGRAIASVLFGDYSPEGKLPITFYKTTEELGEFTDYAMKHRTYRYMKNEPLYPFGFGLSYSKFELDNVCIDSDTVCKDKPIKITGNIKNIGDFDTAQTVQVYIKSNVENAPSKSLKGLLKVKLNKGESKQFEICLEDKDFGIYDDKGVKKIFGTDYDVYVGFSQPDSKSVSLLEVEPIHFKLKSETEYQL